MITTSLFSMGTTLRLREALKEMMVECSFEGDQHHVEKTPERVIASFEELLSGTKQDPKEILQTSFEESSYNQMITVESIDFVSICMHHLLPFYGQVTFAYLPDHRIVGLSKIPRMVDILAKRLQVQERLTQQIVDTFQDVVQPLGCGAMVHAWHGCVVCRGVKKANVRMRTTALAGYFLTKPEVKAEFLAGCRL